MSSSKVQKVRSESLRYDATGRWAASDSIVYVRMYVEIIFGIDDTS